MSPPREAPSWFKWRNNIRVPKTAHKTKQGPSIPLKEYLIANGGNHLVKLSSICLFKFSLIKNFWFKGISYFNVLLSWYIDLFMAAATIATLEMELYENFISGFKWPKLSQLSALSVYC